MRLHELPKGVRRTIRRGNGVPNVRNASRKAIPFFRAIGPVVQIVTSTKIVNFFVVEKLAKSVILVCDFCDVHAEAIKPIITVVDMDDVLTVPIIRQPLKPNTDVPLLEEQEFKKQRNLVPTKIKTVNRVRLKPAT